MGHHSKYLTSTSERRFVLADKFAPKAERDLVAAESSAFGAPTPIHRKVVSKPETQQGELQDSIKSILAKFE